LLIRRNQFVSDNHRRTLLVTGASGHLGQRVIELLLESNAGHVIAATRTPKKLAHLAARCRGAQSRFR
jgi:uncharacterized protein YbjT (DUF2867 family)